MSNEGRPEFRALAELERVLGHVQEELASWRRRAHKAESDRTDVGIGSDVVVSRERIADLERVSQDRGNRLDLARDRVDGLLSRLKFLEEQTQMDEQNR